MSEEKTEGTTYTFQGEVKANAIGNDVQVSNSTVEGSIVSGGKTEETLAQQLVRLLKNARQEAIEPDQKLALGAIDAATDAAKKGDEKAAHGFLKMAGKWGYDLAVKITADLAADIIKKQAGL